VSTTEIVQADAAQFMDFAEPAPVQEVADNPDALRYGWSPGQDIDVSDRKVGDWLQPDGTRRAIIRRCALVPFRTIPLYEELINRVETAQSAYAGQIGAQRQMGWGQKSAKNCAEEVRYAYSRDTPIGFTVFDAPWAVVDKGITGAGFVGFAPAEAFELYKLILPVVLKPNDILLYLLTESEERVKGAGLPPEIEAATLAVRRQMIDAVTQCTTEYATTLDLSEREIGERRGTGKGKPVYDARDRHIAEMLDRTLGAPKAQMQTPAPVVSDPQVGEALKLIAENMRPQGESEEVRLLREQNELLKKQLAAKDKASPK
jgi:hypothetical protein